MARVLDLLIRLWVKFQIIPVIVGPEEMAVKVILGEPVDFLDSGLHWIPLFFNCYVVRYPKKMYNLTYPSRKVITKEAEYGAPPRKYGAQALEVDSVAYVRFPRDKNLIGILQSQVSTDEQKLMDFTEEAVVGALRVALGEMTWREATENMAEVAERAQGVFKKTNALIKAGFRRRDLRLTIKEIRIPRELEAALPAPDKARLNAEAAEFVAKTRATETVGTVIEMMAKSRGQPPEKIQRLIEKDPDAKREFLELSQDLIKRQMAIDGKSFVDIRVEGAEGIEKTLLDLVAAWKRMPEGKPEKEEKKGREVRVPGGTRIMSEEERRRLGLP